MENKDLFESEGDDSSKDEENELVMLGLTSLLGTRYLEQRNFHVVKSKHWYHHILPKYDDYRFKVIMRMNPNNFQKLVSILVRHPIFQNNSNLLLNFNLQFFCEELVLKKTFLKYVQDLELLKELFIYFVKE